MSAQRLDLPSRPVLVVPALILLAGILAQSATYLNHDVAWVLYSSDRMLDGAVFGRDIIAANPPLIWWLSMIPNVAARVLHIPVIGTFRVFVLAIIGWSVIVSDLLLRGHTSRPQRTLFLGTAAYLLTIGVHRDFGQREHLSVALVLPYVLSIARRMRGCQLSACGGFLIGAAATIGIAFKPHFLLVPVALECALFWRRRLPALVWRPEALGAAAAFVLYAAALPLLAWPWLFDALPAIARVYWAFEVSDASFFASVALPFAMPLIGLCLVLRFNPSTEVVALALASAGFLGAAVIQSKYYSYHVFPAFAYLLLASVYGIWEMPRLWRATATFSATLALGLNLMGSINTLLDRTDLGRFGSDVAEMSSFLDQHVALGGTFLAISTHPYPGFPTALYAHRVWSSESNSDIFLPAVVRLRQAKAPANSQLLRFAETKAREAMLRDLSKKPDLVLIDRHAIRHAIGATKFDFLNFYLEDARFRQLWDNYLPLTPAPAGYAAYVRKKGRRRDGTVA